MSDWTRLREQFPVTENLVYLNHAAVSPLPLRCTRGMRGYLEELSGWGAHHYPAAAFDTLEAARALGARLLHTGPARVFFVRSTSQGLGIAATGIPFREGDNLVLVDREFPANLRPWLPLGRRGVEIRRVAQRDGRVPIDDLRAAMDGRTRALSISFVQFLSGFRLEPAAVAGLCREHDALFVLDAIQGLGVFPLDVEAAGVDFLAADAHKWMLGPEGVGLGYASPRALERIRPALEGWLAVERPFDFFDLDQPLKSSAARYEEGAPNQAGIHGLHGSLELLLEAGIENMAGRILELTDRLAEGFERDGWQVVSPRATEAEKSGIVLATREGLDCERLGKRLHDAGISVSVRGGALRVSPHAYNTEQEIDRLLEELQGN